MERHNWSEKKYNKENPVYNQVCKDCGLIKVAEWKPPYRTFYVDPDGGEQTEKIEKTCTKMKEQLKLF